MTRRAPRPILSAVTLTGMKPLLESTPLRLARRATIVALASGLGGALWVFGDAASPVHVSPLAPPAPPTAALVPAAWALEPASWRGLAALPARLGAIGLHWPGFLIALLVVAGSALAVVHPGAFQRTPPYRLPRPRAAVAYGSALLVGMALPATAFAVAAQVGPLSPFDVSGAMRVALGIVAFCACLWTFAGRDVWHPRALVRFAHGGMAGFGIAGTFTIAALLLTPLEPLVRHGAVAAAIRDLGLGSPGATWGTLLGWRLVIVALAFATAGAVAVTAGPQSVGSRPRLGAGLVAAAALAALLVAGVALARAVPVIARELDPDVAGELALTAGTPRAVVLLPGNGRVAVPRRTVGHDAETLRLYRECGHEGAAVPAPSTENLQRLHSALAATDGAVSVHASRLLACRALLHALRFEPDLAAATLFDDPSPGRLPLATLGAAVRGVVERSAAPAARRWLALLADTARFAGAGQVRAPLLRRLSAPIESTATVTGTLAVEAPARWRVALVRGVADGQPGTPRAYAPITGAQVLQYMAAAATPDADGRFALAGVAPGTWQLALLAPDGSGAAAVAALSVRGEPGQFSVLAADRRDLGTIRLGR